MPKKMKHISVFEEPGTYAGWPANHGAWQWGNELLVGFIRGKHNIGGMHNVAGPLQKVLARSYNGGDTWLVETPNVDFECHKEYSLLLPQDTSAIMRVCGRYDHGGEACSQFGGFYSSTDRGKTWSMPTQFRGIALPSNHKNTSRTCVLDDLVFLSAAPTGTFGADYTLCVRRSDRGFEFLSVVRADNARAVMPAAARIDNRIVVVLRRRGGTRTHGCWIDAVYSEDEGMTWSHPVHVMDTGIFNGNPPALIELDGMLYCAAGYRGEDFGQIKVYRSADRGDTWSCSHALREGAASDIGYPRLFKRDDGKLVCVYYWSEYFDEPQRIAATIFQP